MSRGAIRWGDSHSGGGTMIEASGFPIDGKPQCLLGDHARCPKHKGTYPLVSGGDAGAVHNGRPLVFEPAQLACGCAVYSSCGGQFSRA